MGFPYSDKFYTIGEGEYSLIAKLSNITEEQTIDNFGFDAKDCLLRLLKLNNIDSEKDYIIIKNK